MKNIITTFLWTSLAGTALLVAQSSSGAPHTPPSPGAIAQRRVNALTTHLGLSSAQQSTALTIFTAAISANSTPQSSLRTARQSLKTAIETNNTGSIGSLTTEIGTLTAQIASNAATAEAAFYQILTPAQQTTFSQSPGLDGAGLGGGPEFRGRR